MYNNNNEIIIIITNNNDVFNVNTNNYNKIIHIIHRKSSVLLMHEKLEIINKLVKVYTMKLLPLQYENIYTDRYTSQT